MSSLSFLGASCHAARLNRLRFLGGAALAVESVIARAMS